MRRGSQMNDQDKKLVEKWVEWIQYHPDKVNIDNIPWKPATLLTSVKKPNRWKRI